ncbi:MAG: hypothetical protein ACKVTZ_07915 [Bacteroidia bacterium]
MKTLFQQLLAWFSCRKEENLNDFIEKEDIPFRKRFENLIASAKISEVIELAEAYLESHEIRNEETIQELTELKAKFIQAKRNNQLGLITNEEWIITQNQVGFGLLELNFEEEVQENEFKEQKVEENVAQFIADLVTFKKRFQHLLGQGLIDQAIQLAEHYITLHTEGNEDTQKRLIVSKGKWGITKKNARLGMITRKEKLETQGDVAYELLNLDFV